MSLGMRTIVCDEIEYEVCSDGCDTSMLGLAHRAMLLAQPKMHSVIVANRASQRYDTAPSRPRDKLPHLAGDGSWEYSLRLDLGEHPVLIEKPSAHSKISRRISEKSDSSPGFSAKLRLAI
jgi:hypothetical protein